MELTFEYWNKLASQTITISSLLGGFSIAVVANLLVSEVNTKLLKSIMASAVLAACFFLVNIFAMTNIILKTTEGYPYKILASDMTLPRIAGMFALSLGIISLLVLISLSGWTKSKNMGRFTTFFGVITLILIFAMTS